MRRRRLPILAAVSAAALLSLLAAGCGGGSSPGVANVASSTTGGTATAPAATATPNGALPFARCMRSHGVPGFPDPDGSGRLPKRQVVAARKADPSRFDSANGACRHLLPKGAGAQGQTITPAQRADYLRAAACMRSHGFPDFPDPTFQNNNVQINIPASIDQDSSKFKSASETCTKLIPSGLPYSKPSGA